MPDGFWGNIAPVIITAVGLATGGAIGVWRFLASQENKRESIQNDMRELTWREAQETIERLQIERDDCYDTLASERSAGLDPGSSEITR